MPANPEHKIAVLTGGTSEFMRWKTATQTTDELIYRIMDPPMFQESVRFVSMLCLPTWRQGYADPDAMLAVVSRLLISRVRANIPPPIPGTDGSTEGTGIVRIVERTQSDATGALRAILDDAMATDNEPPFTTERMTVRVTRPAGPIPIPPFDSRIPSDVLTAWGVSQDLPRYVPSDCLESLVSMMRVADSHRPRPQAYADFIGFYLQLLAHRFASLNRVGVTQSPVRMPNVPASFPTELLERFPQRLAREELRAQTGDADWIEHVPHGDAVRVLMDIYRLNQAIRNDEPEELRRLLLEQLHARMNELRERAEQVREPASLWTLPPDRPYPTQPGPRTIPPPMEPAPFRYIPGSLLARDMERAARQGREERQRAIREATRPRRRPIVDD